MDEAFGIRVRFADGTDIHVPLSFDYSNLDVREFAALLEQVGPEPIAIAAAPLYLQVKREVPHLDFPTFLSAVGPVLEGQGDVELI